MAVTLDGLEPEPTVTGATANLDTHIERVLRAVNECGPGPSRSVGTAMPASLSLAWPRGRADPLTVSYSATLSSPLMAIPGGSSRTTLTAT